MLGFTVASAKRDGLEVETNRGRREVVRTTKFEVSNRGNKGRQIIKRGQIDVLDTEMRTSLSVLREHVFEIIREYQPEQITSLIGYGYLINAAHAL